MENETKMLIRFIANRRAVGTAYLLFFTGMLGLLGAHRFYLGRTVSAVLMLVLTLTILGLIITIPWALIDLFLIPGMVRHFNNDLMREITEPSV